MIRGMRYPFLFYEEDVVTTFSQMHLIKIPGPNVVLEAGLVWVIGDGRSVRVWDDPSLHDGGPPLLPLNGCDVDMDLRVLDLINPATGSWDIPTLLQFFDESEGLKICTLPVC
ncbi:hypothetical protein OROMI_016311 [Orobanche minor]